MEIVYEKGFIGHVFLLIACFIFVLILIPASVAKVFYYAKTKIKKT